MKIGNKITIFYTGITICILFIVTGIFYLSITRYVSTLFDSYLAEKAMLTAQKHWERDEIDDASYLRIQKKYNELLPQATEILWDADNPSIVKDSLDNYLTYSQKQLLFKGNPIAFDWKKSRGTALYYPDNEGNFVVIVMAQNKYGNEIKKHTLMLAGIIMLAACIFIYLIGRIHSYRILYPLQSILRELKRIRANNLNIRLKSFNNKDELDELTHSLNNMLDGIDIAFQAEKSFISNASHELNNPLTAIQGECEITLKRDRSTLEYKEALQRISEESQRLSLLTRNLLLLSRAEQEMSAHTQETVPLYELLDEIVSGQDRICFNYSHTDTSVLVSANRHLLKTALNNIINNALKYSDKQVIIDLYAEHPKENAIISIKDYGIGIPANEIPYITQPFYRCSNTRRHSGQGIGLNMALKIIALHNGRVNFESEINKYTCVKVFLPAINSFEP